ncbi:MAG: hypothetical protein HN527_15310, partial [Rhodospirillaceae bacterium]|nr:hypothetical protein [Rhodospirillaceae bacterium]
IVWRDGKHVPLEVTIGRLEEYELSSASGAKAGAPLEMRFVSLGITLSRITAELRDKYELAEDSKGVVVTDVSEDFDASGDIRPGDLIVGFGSDRITDLSDFRLRLDLFSQTESKSVVLYRQRGDKGEFVTLGIKRS